MDVYMTLYITTLPNGFFGSAGQSWKTLNVNRISDLIKVDSKIITINELLNTNLKSTDTVLYTSSDEENIRFYIQNIMYFIDKRCQIIPSYEMLLSHENKGFQELYKTLKNFGNLSGKYFYDIDEASAPMPKVLKTISGAGSSGVFLLKDEKSLKEIRKKHFDISKKRKLIKLQRKLKLNKQEFSIYSYRHKGFNLFVEQEFIPNLQHDFKVLVFGDRFYVLKRSIRDDDFRASGSGKFEFITPPTEVLEFAKEISLVLNNPYLSLDIALSDNGCYLIEYQGTNFGPYTLLNAPYRFVFTDGDWKKEENDKDLEANYAYAINKFLGK